MNRRQKMKRMKQELEWYKKQMVPTREVGVDSRQMRVETVGASTYYHGTLDSYCRARDLEGYAITIKECICNELAKCLKDYIDIDVEYLEVDDIYVYKGKLKVVVPHGGDRI